MLVQIQPPAPRAFPLPSLLERLADPTDPLRQILEAARAWGVSPSVFLGRRVVTTYQHNAAGQVVRSEAEPAWTAEDREHAFALQTFEAGLCGGCGHPLEDTTGSANEEAFLPELAVRCWRCTASGWGVDKYQESFQPQALMIPVKRRAVPSPDPGEGVPARGSPSPSTQLDQPEHPEQRTEQ